MCIPNFQCIAQFGGVMRGVNSKNWIKSKKSHIWECKMMKWNWESRSPLPPQDTSRVLKECVYLISSAQHNLEESYSRNNLNKKKRTKNYIFGSIKGWKGNEESRPPKNTYRVPKECITNFKCLSQFRGELFEEQSQWEKKSEKLHFWEYKGMKWDRKVQTPPPQRHI